MGAILLISLPFMMLSSSTSFFAPPLLSSSSFSAVPCRTSQISLSATTASSSYSYTRAEEPPRLHQIPQRLSATPSLYEILEIPIGSTSQEIKSAYRRLARSCHPDVAAGGNDRNCSSADAFVNIHAAYCTLSDPEKRAVYDRKILRGGRTLALRVSRFGSYGGGNWETDQCW